MSYIILNGTAKTIKFLSGGRIVPADEELKDPWTYKLEGGFFPPWIQRLAAKREGGKVEGIEPVAEKDHASIGSSSGEGHVIDMEGKDGAGNSRTGEVPEFQGEKMA